MAVHQNSIKQLVQVSLGCHILHLRCGRRNAAAGADKLVVEGVEVDLPLGGSAGLPGGHARTCLVFDGNLQTPAIACVSRDHLQSRDRLNLAEIITLFVAKVIFGSRRDLAKFDGTRQV